MCVWVYNIIYIYIWERRILQAYKKYKRRNKFKIKFKYENAIQIISFTNNLLPVIKCSYNK